MKHESWSEARIEAALSDAPFPPTPDLAASVSRRLHDRDRYPAPWLRMALAAAGVAVVGIAASLAVSATFRHAVADWLGVLGIRITFQEELPAGVGRELRLGEEVRLAEASVRAGFPVQVPRALGPPARVYLAILPSGGHAVSMIYEASDSLPEGPSTGIGALFMQFEARLHPELVKKVVAQQTRVTPVDVDGAEGYWIAGAPHGFAYRGPDGRIHEDRFRLADNVLLWEREGIAYRIESALTLMESIRIARSLTP